MSQEISPAAMFNTLAFKEIKLLKLSLIGVVVAETYRIQALKSHQKLSSKIVQELESRPEGTSCIGATSKTLHLQM